MGNALYTINRNGQEIDAGYAVTATCEEPGCTEQIDRGIAHLCGDTPGGDEHGCGQYFCADHLAIGNGPASGACTRCARDEGDA